MKKLKKYRIGKNHAALVRLEVEVERRIAQRLILGFICY